MNNLEKYKFLKGKVDFIYKGVHLNNVCALKIWQIATEKNKHKFSIRHFARMVLTYDLSPLNINRPVFSTFGNYNRNDHLELYNSIIKKIHDKVSSTNIMYWKRKIVFHPITIIRSFFFFYKLIGLSLSAKIDLAIDYIYFCNLILELDKKNFSQVNKYLCMCNVLSEENLLTQYMKTLNIPTYSLTEGCYFIYKTNPPIDSITYENFETDNLLCWGQFTKDQFTSYGINPKRMIVAGYPKKVNLIKMKNNNSFYKCVVLLARYSYHHSNMKLLKLLSEHTSAYKFYLKFHPNSDIEYYSKYAFEHDMNVISKEKNISECLDNKEYDFIIAVNTTAYYEGLIYGIPCLRFSDGSFDLQYGYDDVFSNSKEFLDKLTFIKSLPTKDYQKRVDDILQYAIGCGIDNYAAILLKGE